MAFSLGDDDDVGMSEMNLIPLIDIMLVLMIIFLVTATVLNPTVPLDLPKTAATVSELPENVVQLSIDKTGQIFLDKTPLTMGELEQILLELKSSGESEPTIHLRADKEGKYDTVAQVLALASTTGLSKIAFVNE
ncbi:MAG: biopolymer transporter ExbD [Moraxella sp.]|nr:biopolymer transporter ExbD [Moraxella sp.]